MQTFAKRLRELRKERNLSQKQVATILNIRQQSYVRYELNTSEPCYEMLVKIARFFEVSTDFLLGVSDY